MRSIFIRIYTGMIVMLIVIAFVAFLTMVKINQYRMQTYLDDVAKGTFSLIASGAARHHGEKRRQWLSVVKRLTGLDFQLRKSLADTLTASEQAELDSGSFIIQPSLGQQLVTFYLALPIEPSNKLGQERYLSAEISDVSEQLARVTALLLLNELGRHPKQDRAKALSALQKDFGYPLARIGLEQASLDYSQKSRLADGDIVLALSDATSSSPVIQVYAPYGNSGDILAMGPIALFDWFPVDIIVYIGILALLAMGLSSYLLVRPLELRLKLMDVQVAKLGTSEGLSLIGLQQEGRKHVEYVGDDAIANFGKTVNNMAQRIAALLNSQKELTQAISHELRTPLARMKFRLEILDSNGYEEQKRPILGIRNDIQLLDDLVDEILTYSALDQACSPLAMEHFDLYKLLEKLESDSLALDSKFKVKLLVPSPCFITADPHYMKRALQNLFVNANKYANEYLEVQYKFENELHYVSISDDGPGIPISHRERIFEPFTRLDSSRNRKSGGYGLGLAIVEQIIHWHQGNISVMESDFSGAKFEITWPVIVL